MHKLGASVLLLPLFVAVTTAFSLPRTISRIEAHAVFQKRVEGDEYIIDVRHVPHSVTRDDFLVRFLPDDTNQFLNFLCLSVLYKRRKFPNPIKKFCSFFIYRKLKKNDILPLVLTDFTVRLRNTVSPQVIPEILPNIVKLKKEGTENKITSFFNLTNKKQHWRFVIKIGSQYLSNSENDFIGSGLPKYYKEISQTTNNRRHKFMSSRQTDEALFTGWGPTASHSDIENAAVTINTMAYTDNLTEDLGMVAQTEREVDPIILPQDNKRPSLAQVIGLFG